MAKTAHYKNKSGKEIDWTVHVYSRPNLRDNEMLVYVGLPILHNIFEDHKTDTETKIINLMFPERWTNIIEQRALTERIPLLYPNIEKVDITTHSVYILQCSHAQNVLIYEDAKDYPEKDYADISRRYCRPLVENKGLMVFRG